MTNRINTLLKKEYPQNFITKNPASGTLFYFFLIFCFLIIYKPLHINSARSFSISVTMLLYCAAISIPVLILANAINRVNSHTKSKEWTFGKEVLSIAILLTTIGFCAYLAGFIIETPTSRWDLHTFADAFSRAVLVGLIPYLFTTLPNTRYLFSRQIEKTPAATPSNTSEKEVLPIQIVSKAKKEELTFLPDQLIYAESEGNYVTFHLAINGIEKSILIRNSISSIEQQLAAHPQLMRVHRAFIVNVSKVCAKSGNTLGYRLKVAECSKSIPVSRQNTHEFNLRVKQYS
ncbi:LytR/AlgR family response regulator transcription factor [Alistipes sp. ZOR0009]|uniref:LytR/AlgR family response regulator transcription factor n=1 Tax=Alistipes sp. ZOR0009 TaxID=1339253 RepID=UPI000645D254|nr:LytTR family DNA-binding domain-containing protein [Alistipes sp. ZOR0009]